MVRQNKKQFLWDAFISHASEDKDSFVRPLFQELTSKGCRIWYDEYTLVIGDSLRRSIDNGLSTSQFGIVVLSPHFFSKEWPQKELDGLAIRERNGRKVILPVWLDIDSEGVAKYSLTLADRVAAKANEGLNKTVTKLLLAMEIGIKYTASSNNQLQKSLLDQNLLNTYKIALTSEEDDIPGEAMDALVKDHSIEAITILYENTVWDALSGNNWGFGPLGLMSIGALSAPWIYQLLSHEDDRVVKFIYHFLTNQEMIMNIKDSHNIISIIEGVIGYGDWKQCERRLIQAIPMNDQNLIQLLEIANTIKAKHDAH